MLIMNNFCLDSTRTDDFCFLMDGTQISFSVCLDTLELFGECSRLNVKVKKAKSVWLGSKRFSNEVLLPEKNLARVGF